MATQSSPAKLLPARARLSTALQSVATRPFTRAEDDDETDDADEQKRRRKRKQPAAPPRTLAAALQQLTGRF